MSEGVGPAGGLTALCVAALTNRGARGCRHAVHVRSKGSFAAIRALQMSGRQACRQSDRANARPRVGRDCVVL